MHVFVTFNQRMEELVRREWSGKSLKHECRLLAQLYLVQFRHGGDGLLHEITDFWRKFRESWCL
ncbi:hypothetical protein WJ28_16270 [Burkholderia thailandensis]|nr:hypothetical protein WJ27_00115 [Burkholderia thailandensis]KVG14541.1 hypothetical protein WJ28_16270 [Burkholderia thailandensis]